MRGDLIRARVIWLGLITALAARPAVALHRETPGATRLTRTTTHPHSSGRSWGNYLAFASDQNLANNTPPNMTRQIFVFNSFQYVCQRGQPEPATAATCPNPPVPFIQQVTNRPGDPDNPSITLARGHCQASVDTPCQEDADCLTQSLGTCVSRNQWVAFDALGVFNGLTGPSSTRRQIFVRNLRTQEILQVTNAADGDSVRPSVASLGGLIVFESTAPLAGVPNPSGASQIFAYERDTNLLRQITFGSAPSIRPMTNHSGTLIAFQSTAHLLGDGSDTGISQIYWADYDRRTHTATINRLTNGNASSENPYISERDHNIAFDSLATDLGGLPGGRQVYVSSAVTQESIQLRQVTFPSRFGECFSPAIGPGGDRVAFICTGDPLSNGTVGNRLFNLDLNNLTLWQITGAGDVQPPIGTNLGRWFLTLSTTSDLTAEGSCAYQLYMIDYYDEEPGHWQAAKQLGQLPPDVAAPPGGPGGSNLIGRRNFEILQWDGLTGSQATLTTSDGATLVGMGGMGTMPLVIGAPDEFTKLSSIAIPAGQTNIPPIVLPGIGAICLAAAEDGTGIVDCDGGGPGGDLVVSQDHNTDDTNPSCIGACRESDESCQGDLGGPHQNPCPVCDNGFCSLGSTNAGAPCGVNTDCIASSQCIDSVYGVCNGVVHADEPGTFIAGGMQVSLPVILKLSTDKKGDGLFCTTDDTYTFENVNVDLHLTTGSAAGAILDAGNVPGASLSVSQLGAPFNCVSLRANVLAGARLVGSIPVLDVPNIPGLRDALLSLDLLPRPEPGPCGVPCAGNVDCDDGNPCNGAEVCSGGACFPGTPPPSCDDGDPCNGLETCDPNDPSGQSCLAGTPCNDLNPCNGTETCDPVGGCVPGFPVICPDPDVCDGLDTCDPTTGLCITPPPPVCDDGNPCNGLETCNPSTGCEPGTPLVCPDPDQCDGIDACEPATGLCVTGPPPLCDDGNICTDDSCDATLGCLHSNNASSCDDGNFCTLTDTCLNGTCLGAPVVCDDADPCNGLESCEPASGACLPGIPPTCDDGNICTDDSCQVGFGCLHANNANPCDDGTFCTTSDTCQLGLCTGVPLLCDDADVCNGAETCDPASGCQLGTPLSCDDGNTCTGDSCDAGLGCLYSNLSGPCDDSNLCTTSDTCVSGTCSGTALVCTDGNACNGLETCNPLSGSCEPSPPLACDDNDPCNGVETCDAALGCQSGTPIACDDGNACNGAETCNPLSGTCLPGTGPPDCDDNNPCTVDSCVPPGCDHEPIGGCVFDAMESMLLSVSAEEVGGPKKQRKLRNLIGGARAKFADAVANPGAVRPRNAARRKTQSFIEKVQRGLQAGKIDSSLANDLLELANNALQAISGLTTGAP